MSTYHTTSRNTHTHTHTGANLCQNLFNVPRSDMMQNIILPFKSPTDTRTYNIGYKAPCKSCQCKRLQTYESSSEQFPCTMVHLEPTPTPFPSVLAFTLCPPCQWHHLKFSSLHHLLRGPNHRPLYPFRSPDFYLFGSF